MSSAGPAASVSLEKSPADWREWWMRNEWRFKRSARNQVKVTGDVTGVTGKSLHAERARNFLLRALEDRYGDVRASACIALGKLGDSGIETLKALERAVRDGEREVEKSAVLALGMQRARASTGLLRRLLERTETPVPLRVTASIALGLMGDPGNIDVLARRANRKVERHAEVRAGAVLGLGLIGGDRAAVRLVSVLNGRDEEKVMALALSALANTGRKVVSLRKGRRTRNIDLARVFENILGNKNFKVETRRASALGLGKLGDRASVRVLMREARRDRDEMVRASALLSLGELAARLGRREKIHGFLLRCVALEKDGLVRPYLFLALGLSRDPRGVPPLRRAFLDENAGARGAAAIALGLIGDAGSVKYLGEALVRPGSISEARWFACQGLGLIGGPESRRMLLHVLRNSHVPYLRAAACKGLAALGDRSAVPLLVGKLRSRNRVVRTWATRTVSAFGDAGAIPGIIEAFESESSPEIRALAVVSLGNIVEAWEEMPVLRRISDHCNWLAARKFKTLSLLLRLL